MPELTDKELMAIASGQQTGIIIPGDPAKVISVRQNNPGNIKFANRPLQAGIGDRAFAVYESPEKGFEDIQELIEQYKDSGTHTLSSFAHKYAPSFENDTNNWIKVVGKYTGAGPNTPLSQIPTFDLARGIAFIESSTKVPPQQTQISDDELMAIAGKAQSKPTLTLPQEAAAIPQASPEEAQAAMGLLAPQPGQVASIPELVGQSLERPQSLESKVTQFGKGFLDYLPQGLQENAPIMGAMSGGTTGARLGAMAGPLGALGGGVVGAGLGGMFGRQAQSVGKMAQGEQLPPVTEQAIATGKQGLESAKDWMLGENIGATVSKVFAPVKNWYDRLKMSSKIAAEVESAVKSGVPVSPDIQAPHPLTKLYQWWVEKLPFGKTITDKYRWDSVKGINAMRDNFIKESGLPSARTPEEVATLVESRKALYGKAIEEAKGSIIPIPNIKEAIANLPKEGLASRYYQKVLKPKLIKDGQLVEGLSFDDINDAFIPTKIWGTKFDAKTMPPAQLKWRTDLQNAMKQDVSAFDAAQGKKVLQNYESAHKMGDIIRGTNKSNWLENALNESTSSFEMREMFDPGKFSKALNSKEFKRMFTKSERDLVSSFAQKMELIGQDLARLQKPGPGLGTFIPMAGAAYVQPVTVPLGFPLFTAWSLMKPNGLVRRWLTSGLTPGRTIASTGLAAKIGAGQDKEE